MLKIYKTEETGKLAKLKKSKSISKSWFNLINPTAEEIRQVSQLLKVDSDILRNSLDADERSRVELDEGIFSTIVNLPLLDEEGNFDTLPCGLVFSGDNFLTICSRDNRILSSFNKNTTKTFDTRERTKFMLSILYKITQFYLRYLAIINRKTEHIREVAWPVIQRVYEEQGHMYERIMVPITDGRRVYNIACNLKEAYETECKVVVKEFEKQMLLHIIDESWKENLRELDELRHSVQNASYEQKDPLLIFKLESAKVWDNMINEMNNRTMAVLNRGQIPEMQQQEVREAAPEEHTNRQQYTENKQSVQEEELVDRGQQAAAQNDTRAQQPRTPIVRDKMPGRNDPCPCGSGKKFKNCHGKGLV